MSALISRTIQLGPSCVPRSRAMKKRDGKPSLATPRQMKRMSRTDLDPRARERKTATATATMSLPTPKQPPTRPRMNKARHQSTLLLHLIRECSSLWRIRRSTAPRTSACCVLCTMYVSVRINHTHLDFTIANRVANTYSQIYHPSVLLQRQGACTEPTDCS